MIDARLDALGHCQHVAKQEFLGDERATREELGVLKSLQSALGLSEEEATTMVVSGFIEPLVKELPMEYAVEMNRLIQLQMEGSIG